MTSDVEPARGRIGARSFVIRSLLVLALPLSFRTFQFFPGMLYVQEGWFVLCCLFVIFVYPFWKLRNGLRVSRFELYLLLLITSSISVAAWQAQKVFGQPLAYGLLSQRALVLIACWLILADLLRAGILQPEDIEASLLFLAWSTFLLFTAMRVLLSPMDFLEYGEGLVTQPAIGIEPSFKLQEFFILFGAFYYAIRGIRSGRARYYLAALILFPAALGGSGRGIAISAIIVFVFFLFRLRGLHRGIVALAQFAFLTGMLFASSYALFPLFISARLRGFMDAFAAVVPGAVTQDVSANARILETLTSIPYILAHPLIGNGIVSYQWDGGSQAAVGAYFFVADIGVAGILFSFGVLGLLLYLWQYRIAWVASRKISDPAHGPLLDATKAFLLYSAIYSLESGICVWNADATLFFVAILYGLSIRQVRADATYAQTGGACIPQLPALSA
jgi:hypothetical protein